MSVQEDLIEFVGDALRAGQPRERIAQVLLEAGWEKDQVERAVARFAAVDFPIPVPRPRPYLSAREAFLYLVMFATLYVSAFALGQFFFSLIDRGFPDATRPQSGQMFRDSIRWSVANLIVAFPIFAALAVSTQRTITRDPARRASRVRKWLTYVTLFLGAAILIGDVIGLLNAVLKGEVPTRFLLKVLTVGVIAGTAFTYYLTQLRRDESREEGGVKGQGLLLAAITVVVLAVVVTGFLVMGSPQEARKEELDKRRIEDLRMLANLMTPEPGRPLRDSLDVNGYSPDMKRQLTDPATSEPYEYHLADSTHFELCATFDTEVRPEDLQPYERDWAHAKGRHCFRFDARYPGGPRRVP